MYYKSSRFVMIIKNDKDRTIFNTIYQLLKIFLIYLKKLLALD